MRAEPGSVLELLWQHPQVPRSIVYCLRRCGTLLRESTSTSSSRSAPAAIDEFIHRLHNVNWAAYVRACTDEDQITPDAANTLAGLDDVAPQELHPFLLKLLESTLEIHTLVADSFLNHQAHIAQLTHPRLL
jgi:uncharacterized alpha-E superfamily protein